MKKTALSAAPILLASVLFAPPVSATPRNSVNSSASDYSVSQVESVLAQDKVSETGKANWERWSHMSDTEKQSVARAFNHPRMWSKSDSKSDSTRPAQPQNGARTMAAAQYNVTSKTTSTWTVAGIQMSRVTTYFDYVTSGGKVVSLRECRKGSENIYPLRTISGSSNAPFWNNQAAGVASCQTDWRIAWGFGDVAEAGHETSRQGLRVDGYKVQADWFYNT